MEEGYVKHVEETKPSVWVKLSLLALGVVAATVFLFSSQGPSAIEGIDASLEELLMLNEVMFQGWMQEHSKVYESKAEYKHRLKTFHKNLNFINQENKKGHSYKLGLNQFADLTQDEFAALIGSPYMPSEKPGEVYLSPVVGLNATVNWTAAGAVTPSKNQGTSCKSDWAFSAVGAVEGLNAIQSKGALVPLSAQQLVDCYSSSGCNGGQFTDAYKYIINIGGIATDAAYPYKNKSSTCKTAPFNASISGFVSVTANNSLQLQYAVSNQPVSAWINSNAFQLYESGIITSYMCGTSLNYQVLITGYGVNSTVGIPYWIVKTSLGPSWGQQGYAWIQRSNQTGPGVCGIAMDAAYPYK